LVAANSIIFLYTAFLDPVTRDILFFDYGFVPAEWKRWGNFLTCLFLHGGWLHAIGNMLFLLLFGRLVEDSLGRIGFTVLYLASGLLASVTHLLTTPEFLWDVPCIGASGAVSGILGAAAVIRARETVRVFYLWVLTAHPLFGKVDVPALLFLGCWFLGQFLYAVSFSEIATSVEVAYWAHVGGFAFGAFIGLVFGLGRSLHSLGDAWKRAGRRRAVLNALRRRAWAEAEGALAELTQRDGLPDEWTLLPARIAAEKGATEAATTQAGASLREALVSRSREQLLEAYTLISSVGGRLALDSLAALSLVRALNASGRQPEAMAWLTQTLRRDPDGTGTPGLLFELAEMVAGCGDLTRAAELFRFIARSYPGDKLAHSAEWRAREIEGAAVKK
jgi:membrane associated rhomboid family serine protease